MWKIIAIDPLTHVLIERNKAVCILQLDFRCIITSEIKPSHGTGLGRKILAICAIFDRVKQLNKEKVIIFRLSGDHFGMQKVLRK